MTTTKTELLINIGKSIVVDRAKNHPAQRQFDMNPDLNNLSLAELQERVNAACPLAAESTPANTLAYWFQIGKAHARFEQSQLRRKVLFGWGGKAKPLLVVANRIEASEAEIIERSLRQHNFNQRATARTLKIDRCTLIRRIKKYGIVMPLLLLVVGCVTRNASAVRTPPSAPGGSPGGASVLASRPLAPQLAPLEKRRSAATLAPPKTNGIVSLIWDAGAAPQTLVNQTSGQAYDVGPAAALVLGGQPLGVPQTYVVTNAVGASNSLTVTPAADANRLRLEVYIHRLTWSGAAGVLQHSSNTVHWTDLQPLPSGATVLITNQQPAQFFRVRLN